MRVGVLALQGDVREHLATLEAIGADSVEVRNQSDLDSVAGLIIPGGESTTISKLLDIFKLRSSLNEFAVQGKGIFGTCAGMIMLANEVLDAASGQQSLGLLDVSVRRNAFGSQLDSFEEELIFNGELVKAAFIRAPIVERVGEGVEVLSTLPNGEIVAVRAGRILATAFHPEIVGERKVH
ncbi:MAG: pyridoxal 5'-phosphate synthase glutaminase subunit PdxT, partial [Actinomycetota bacterium]